MTRQLDLYIVVLTPKGLPDPSSTPIIHVESGSSSEPSSLGEGLWEASFTADASSAGLVKIQVSIEGEDLPPGSAAVVVEENTAVGEGAEQLAIAQEETAPKDAPEEEKDQEKDEPPPERSPVVSAALTAGYAWELRQPERSGGERRGRLDFAGRRPRVFLWGWESASP